MSNPTNSRPTDKGNVRAIGTSGFERQKLKSGKLKAGIGNLERLVAHQAKLCGATYTIKDLDGDVMELTDEALPPNGQP